MIKGSVWVYIYSVYTRDKRTITEARSSLIFIPVLNEKNSEFTLREKKKRSREGEQSSSGGRAAKPSMSIHHENRKRFNVIKCKNLSAR